MPLDDDIVQAVPDDGTLTKKRARYRNLMLVQQVQHLKPPYDSLDAMVDLVKRQKPESYGAILHDKDTGEAPHIHIFMHFSNPREIQSLAKKLHIAPQYINKWDENEANGYLYLCHRTKTAQQKGDYQYDPAEVKASFNYVDWLPKAEAEYKLAHEKKSKSPIGSSTINDPKFLLDALYAGAISREEVEARLTGSQYARYRRQIEDICAKRQRDLANKWRREMRLDGKSVKVVWISGPAGTGKTRWAKDQAAKLTDDFFITGSSRDPFARYRGQSVIIYDEARPADMPYADFLRLLDPFSTDSAAPSRYYDKPLTADTVFITSPYSPIYFYTAIFPPGHPQRTTDKIEQLLRRITLTIEMTETSIFAVQFDSKRGYVEIAPRRDNPYYKQPTATSSVDPANLFNSFFDDTSQTYDEQEVMSNDNDDEQ
ncbi:MAG: Rep family protein [Butyricicoccus sp.]|nr:Rep family protein [Butyricicoccus sp.]